MLHATEASNTLDVEKALTLAAIAARAWCSIPTDERQTGDTIVGSLMLAASWTNRVRRLQGLPAITIGALVAAFPEPIESWLPGEGSFALVEDGEPTPICLDLAEDAGSSPLGEAEQQVVKVAMRHFAGRQDGAEAYTVFRRFLVENAHATLFAAAAAVQMAGVELSKVYRRVPASALDLRTGEEVFYPCPRCRWPMRIGREVISCHRSRACLAAGARFAWRDSALVGLGRLEPPEPVRSDGQAALLPGIWRFTVLPGLEELALADHLARIDGVVVELWPYVDAYDLDVKKGSNHWRIDVKDHSSATSLARHLNEHPVSEPTWLVVPDARREQVRVLEKLVESETGYRFASASEIVRRVKGAS